VLIGASILKLSSVPGAQPDEETDMEHEEPEADQAQVPSLTR
jgi:hypothetical protein